MQTKRVELASCRPYLTPLCLALCLFTICSSASAQVALKTIPISDEELEIKITSPAQCTWGDLDILTLDVREHLQKQIPTKVYASIESMDGSVFSSAETNIEQFYTGKDKELGAVKFQLPKVTEKKLVGIYICKDSKNGTDCRTKKLQDYKEIFHRHTLQFKDGKPVSELAKSQVDPAKAGEDSIYYYQPAILTADGLQIVNDDFSEQSLKEFSEDLKANGIATSKEISHVEKGILLLKSGPIVFKAGDGLIIELPSSDQSKCSADVNKNRVGSTKVPEGQSLIDEQIN